MKKSKLQKLLKVLAPEESITSDGFDMFDKGVQELKSKLQETLVASTLEEVSGKIKQLQKDIEKDINKLQDGILQVRTDIETERRSLIRETRQTLDKFTQDSLYVAMEAREADHSKLASDLREEILQTQNLLLDRQEKHQKQVDKVSKTVEAGRETVDALIDKLNEVVESKEAAPVQDLTDIQDQIKRINSRINNLGGGSPNRNISIGGNSSVLSRYTDLNIKAGNNVTLTYTNNDTTKNLDLTITGTGGGSGITRTIETTTVSSTIGEVAAVDYVVLANGGVKITLPTAVANSNLYTVKNIGSSSVLIATTGGQTIDGNTTIIMPVQYTSVDVISDSANWKIT